MTSRRVLVALIVLPILYLLVRYLPQNGLFGLVAIVALAGQYEFYRLCYHPPRASMIAAGLLLGLLLIWSVYRSVGAVGGFADFGTYIDGVTLAAALTCVVLGGLLASLLFGRESRTALADVAMLVFGAVYVGWLLAHLLLLRALAQGVEAVLFVLAVTLATDSAAYFGGRYFGRRPLAPRISPNKTIEGAVAGLGGGVVAAWLSQSLFFDSLSGGEAVGIGLVLGCVGQIGDLAESMLKRSAGVKDSGTIIPAHGGVLDKIDSLVFTAPTFYYYLLWIKGYSRVFVI